MKYVKYSECIHPKNAILSLYPNLICPNNICMVFPKFCSMTSQIL